ncbi:protein of unknown function [Duganella sp. CF402]|uniref:SRPBCC family protein n=1 Tax=unclassified Duganella TaxID=2636909 RepID=UPI0008AF3806|nr:MULTISPECIES: SRPBCC family protein [unclassified Duganella]RZT10148.1 uncharacterized protein DUF1857 [Duganella sp. BK701]SEL26105.1 protein of unknown function [Duganella sp. CF402]
MIYAVKEVSVNRFREQGDPLLSRAQVWAGLQRKARNGVPFIPSMTRCEIIEDTETGLIRDVAIRGEIARERVTFYPPKKTVFARLSGPMDGLIVNEILETPDGDLKLRFSFALQLVDVDSGSPEEREFSSYMCDDYSSAVDAVLAEIRRTVKAGLL